MPRNYCLMKKRKNRHTHRGVAHPSRMKGGGGSEFPLNSDGERATGVPAPKMAISDEEMQMKISQEISVS